MKGLFAVVTLLCLALVASAAVAGAYSKPLPAKPAMAKEIVLNGAVSGMNVKHNALMLSWETHKTGPRGKMLTERHHATLSVQPKTSVAFQGKPLKWSEIRKGSIVQVTAEKGKRGLIASRIEVVREPVAVTKTAAPHPAKTK
jgi:hypothetical protein